ncbi:MAG: hypothetical protein ACKVZH_23065 [Blastocatellia bacterium]
MKNLAATLFTRNTPVLRACLFLALAALLLIPPQPTKAVKPKLPKRPGVTSVVNVG